MTGTLSELLVVIQTPGDPAAIVALPVLWDGALPERGPVPAAGEHSAMIRAEFVSAG